MADRLSRLDGHAEKSGAFGELPFNLANSAGHPLRPWHRLVVARRRAKRVTGRNPIQGIVRWPAQVSGYVSAIWTHGHGFLRSGNATLINNFHQIKCNPMNMLRLLQQCGKELFNESTALLARKIIFFASLSAPHRDLRLPALQALRAPRPAFQRPPVRLPRRVVLRHSLFVPASMPAGLAGPGDRVAHGRHAATAGRAGRTP